MTQPNDDLAPIPDAEGQQVLFDGEPCPNCKEPHNFALGCACFRNLCKGCGEPVGNITFTVCDDCWYEEMDNDYENHIQR